MNEEPHLDNDDKVPSFGQPAPPGEFHGIFFGEDGLRPGWGLLIFIAQLITIIICIHFITHKLLPPSPKPGNAPPLLRADLNLIIGESFTFFLTLFITWVMSKIERRPNSVYGLGGRRKIPHFLAGLGWGVTFISLLVGILVETGFIVFDNRLLFGRDIVRYGAFWLFSFLLVGLAEEYLLRGYLLYTLARGVSGLFRMASETVNSAAWGFWTSALILSVIFGLGHRNNPGESPLGLVSAGLAGLVFCFSLWRTGSLWWAIGFHATWDWGQSFLYGVADSGMMVPDHLLSTHPVGKPLLSGGATGPEGSIFVVGVLALACVIIRYTLANARKGEASATQPTAR